MAELTGRLSLPLIAPGQAQKEMTHNEALTLLDIAVHASVVGAGGNTPPSAPDVGQCWIVGPAPTGGWSGHVGAIAGWTASGWRFVEPREGVSAWVADSGVLARHVAGAWRSAAAAIASPAGGTTIDAQARAAIADILELLRNHGLASTS